MKRALLMVCSICLILACLFGLFACVAGMKDVMNIKEYKQYDTEHPGIQGRGCGNGKGRHRSRP